MREVINMVSLPGKRKAKGAKKGEKTRTRKNKGKK